MMTHVHPLVLTDRSVIDHEFLGQESVTLIILSTFFRCFLLDGWCTCMHVSKSDRRDTRACVS